MKHQDKLHIYIDLLKEFNMHTNIYSKSSYDKLNFHIEDCANIAHLITDKKCAVLDLGSGSGLPAVIIAILNHNNHVIAIESKSKKCNFLEQAKCTLELDNLEIINQNIFEFLQTNNTSPDFVTAKAFAPFDKIDKICKRLESKKAKLIVPISRNQALSYKGKGLAITQIGEYLYAEKQYLH